MPDKQTPEIKDMATYNALRRDSASVEKAARIANVRAAGTLRHRATHLEDRARGDLYAEARRIGIAGRSRMTKAQLVDAIRNHG